MAIVVLAVGTTGDVWPMVEIGRELRQLGHRVRIATHLNFRPHVLKYGMEFAPIPPDDSLAVLKSADGARLLEYSRNPIRHVRALRRLYAPLFPRVAEACIDACHDAKLIVRSTLSLVGLHIAEAMKVPSVDVQLQPLTPSSRYAHPLAYQYLPKVLIRSGRVDRLTYAATERILHSPFTRSVQTTRAHLGLPRVTSPGRSREVRSGDSV